MSVADFHALHKRLRLSGMLTTVTALRIGAGASDFTAVDLPVLRDGRGWPLIPGSSLKGALRSTLEALVRAAEQRECGLWSCDPLAGPGKACGDHERGARPQVDPEQHCAICRLLGSHVVASHVRFSDALVQEVASNPIELRDGVAIDRDLRVAKSRHKYDFEVVSPGTRFALEVFIDNPEPWLLGLLVIGFDQIADGFTALGGFTSRGLGRVTLKWSGFTSVTARDLLDNQPAQHKDKAALAAEFATWRATLAEHLQGGR